MRQIAGPYRQRVVAFIVVFGVIALLGGCLSRNQLPIAAFTFTPSAPVAGSVVSFDASASTDPDGTIVQYTWDFGDGGSGSDTPLTHAYAAAGTYTVTLTVTDDDGASDSVSLEITVSPSDSGNQPPTAAFTFAPSAPVAGSLVSFDASASTDPDGTIAQYAWTFGDGTSGSGATASHTYATTGTYTATLTVIDDDGASDSVSSDVAVVASNHNNQPTAAFTGAGFSNSSEVIPKPAAGTEVDFDASASTDPDGTIVQYAWDFGDETTGSGVTVTHIFQNDTNQIIPYTVTLTVTDNDGTSDSASMEIKVTPEIPNGPGYSWIAPSAVVPFLTGG